MNILSINVCRTPWDRVQELICELSSLHLGIFCLQEVSAWPSEEEVRIHGWTLVHKLCSPAALLIPAKYVDMCWTGTRGVHACAVIGCVGGISSYLPDVSKPLE